MREVEVGHGKKLKGSALDQNRLCACVKFSSNKKVNLHCFSGWLSFLPVHNFVLCLYQEKKKKSSNPPNASSNKKIRN